MAELRRASYLYPPALALFTHVVVERLAGAPYLSIAQALRDFYSWPEARRAQWQRARLAEVVQHAANSVPYYRERFGGRPAGSVDLAELPIVDKPRIRSAEDAFRTPGWKAMPHVAKRTGGTTDGPWHYPLDRRAWGHIYGAAIYQRERIGYRYGEPMVLLGAPASLGLGGASWKSVLRRRLERQHTHLAGFEIGRAASAERVRRADSIGAPLWYGYASTIADMAEAVLAEGIDVAGPRAIITTAEQLLPAWRDQIVAAFGPIVHDEYGGNDGGVLSQSCPAGRYHLAENVSIVEILDGHRSCDPGEEGDVTITNLHARVLPFLRYQNGDRAALAAGPCPCGLPGRTLEQIGGRADDRLRLPDGRQLSGVVAAVVFDETPDVRRWQLVQSAPHTLTVRLEVPESIDQRQVDLVRAYFRRHCGPDVAVRVTTDEPIAAVPSGKRRAIIREFP